MTGLNGCRLAEAWIFSFMFFYYQAPNTQGGHSDQFSLYLSRQGRTTATVSKSLGTNTTAYSIRASGIGGEGGGGGGGGWEGGGGEQNRGSSTAVFVTRALNTWVLSELSLLRRITILVCM